MRIDHYLEIFRNRLPGAELIQVSGIESKVLFWENWFLGCYWLYSEPEKLRIQFKFNWDHKELKIFKKAEAMGLLPFHFYQKISQRLEQESYNIIHWTDPVLLSQFLVTDQNLDKLLTIFEKIQTQNLIITETALLSLRSITETYALTCEGENNV